MATSETTPPRPLFYARPVALSPQRHFGKSYRPLGHYGFARNTNSVPLGIGEFALAVRHYPIVFTATAPSVPVAVVGVAAERNLHVDAAGGWREGAYIPAYARRYPFIFLENAESKEYVLGIDEAADALVEDDADGLFRDGKPTRLVEQALAFCSEYQANVNATRRFCEDVEAAHLFSDKEADFELKDGRKLRLEGFRVIDEARFDKLDSKAFLRFRRRGWLPAIYLHFAATANWAALVDLAARAGP